MMEVDKLTVLSSHRIWNAKQEPAWGSEDQSPYYMILLSIMPFADFLKLLI